MTIIVRGAWIVALAAGATASILGAYALPALEGAGTGAILVEAPATADTAAIAELYLETVAAQGARAATFAKMYRAMEGLYRATASFEAQLARTHAEAAAYHMLGWEVATTKAIEMMAEAILMEQEYAAMGLAIIGGLG